MDITAFLTRRGQISLQAMLCAYGFLSESQIQRGFIEFHEIHQGLQMGADLSAAEVDAHSSILYGKQLNQFIIVHNHASIPISTSTKDTSNISLITIFTESAVIPVQFTDRPRKMKFHIDAEGVTSFIKNIIRTIQRKTLGKFSHSLDNFKRDVDHHFSHDPSMTIQIQNALGFSHRAPVDNSMKHGNSMSHSSHSSHSKYIQGPIFAGSGSGSGSGSGGTDSDACISKDLFEVNLSLQYL